MNAPSSFRHGKILRHNAGIAGVILSVAASLCADVPTALANAGTATEVQNPSVQNDIPPRLQWEANYGYCGEVALISAGLYYGQYVSQYDARAIASKNIDQSRQESQLLLGVNDTYAAKHMRLKAIRWNTDAKPNGNDFLAWVKENVAAGYPVIIGVYMNHYLFEESEDEDAGEEEYDHIVPVIGVSSNRPFTKPSRYDSDDVITFSDNGLYSGDGQPAYLYSYAFGSFQANRKEANSKSRPVYSLRRKGGNYGIAVTGIIDRDGKTLPIRLSTNANYEKPAMREGSNTRPKPQKLTLTVNVSGLRPGVPYTLYRYNNFDSVPESSFNANASKASKSWKFTVKAGSTFAVTEEISSDQTAVYRAVPNTAP
ncbi:MAG TPA: C39 family peptidase [Ensifer sp.]|uniref:C39 family peptidase n=1 Tax=Ensifer sp. TaxID=1872086 RepID=UPI002E15DB06|nr:C39 family peptidase [Ensifer sp.]